jgi:hypothetical protein
LIGPIVVVQASDPGLQPGAQRVLTKRGVQLGGRTETYAQHSPMGGMQLHVRGGAVHGPADASEEEASDGAASSDAPSKGEDTSADAS